MRIVNFDPTSRSPPGDLKAWFEPLIDRIEELEAREQKSLADSFRGGYVPGVQYRRGDIVQRRGSTFICLIDSTRPPGNCDDCRMLLQGDGR